MFVFGGALCSPHVRAAAVPDVVSTAWPPDLDRALVLGGCTDWLLDQLRAKHCEITICEPEEHHDEAVDRWGNLRGVFVVELSDGLDDLPAKWFSLVFVCGGTLHTGGDPAGWDASELDEFRAARWTWLQQLRNLVSAGGSVVADMCDTPDTATRGVCHATSKAGTTFVEAYVLPGPGDRQLVLRTQNFDVVGVQQSEHVRQAPWVPLGSDRTLLETGSWNCAGRPEL